MHPYKIRTMAFGRISIIRVGRGSNGQMDDVLTANQSCRALKLKPEDIHHVPIRMDGVAWPHSQNIHNIARDFSLQ